MHLCGAFKARGTYCNSLSSVSDDLPSSSDKFSSCRMVSVLSGKLLIATLPASDTYTYDEVAITTKVSV